jgi:flavodoxin
MKTLIVYYSFTSNNVILAKNLQKRLDCDTLMIEEVKKRNGFTILLDVLFKRTPKIKRNNISINLYDYIIFISPIWAGRIATPLKAFCLREKENINRYAFITVCGGTAGQKDKIFLELSSHIQQEPEVVTELWINDLLPVDKKDTIKHTSGYRLQPKDLEFFEAKITDFLKHIDNFILQEQE